MMVWIVRLCTLLVLVLNVLHFEYLDPRQSPCLDVNELRAGKSLETMGVIVETLPYSVSDVCSL